MEELLLTVWMKIHGFISNNEVVMIILTYLIAEVIKRYTPTKSKESLMELAGKVLRFVLDKTKMPNKLKTLETETIIVVKDVNPLNAGKVEIEATPEAKK